jgi:hypothetical protein
MGKKVLQMYDSTNRLERTVNTAWASIWKPQQITQQQGESTLAGIQQEEVFTASLIDHWLALCVHTSPNRDNYTFCVLINIESGNMAEWQKCTGRNLRREGILLSAEKAKFISWEDK